MTEKICYTAIIGDYDHLFSPNITANKGWKFICFTTQDIHCRGWEIIRVNQWEDAKRQARYVKWISPIKTKPSLWVDARFEIHGSLDQLFNNPHSDMTVLKNPFRETVIEEAKEIIRLGIDDPDKVVDQISRYPSELIRKPGILPALGMVYRRAKTSVFDKIIFKEIQSYSYRDQISFNYAAQLAGLNYSMLPDDVYDRNHPVYKIHKHKCKRQTVGT